ncbi:MAG: DUF433 domain-containing protein [Bryobacterales bacterium]|nr:DUF433 domain-containing protein [Bryobacterales bacterium]
MQDAITKDPEVMHGTPVFRGTRVPVKTLFEYLEHGDTLDDFLEGFPTVSRELAVQVLEERLRDERQFVFACSNSAFRK